MFWLRQSERLFVEGLLLRFERSERELLRGVEALVGQVDRQNAKLDRQNAKLDRQLDQLDDHRREMREEYEAHRGTLLAILDRLDLIDPRQGPPPAQA